MGYLCTAAWFSHFPGFFNGFNLVNSLGVLPHLDALRLALVTDHAQRPVRFSQVEALHKHTHTHIHTYTHTRTQSTHRRKSNAHAHTHEPKVTVPQYIMSMSLSMSNSDSLVHRQPARHPGLYVLFIYLVFIVNNRSF